jgi:hypothetical protein
MEGPRVPVTIALPSGPYFAIIMELYGGPQSALTIALPRGPYLDIIMD